MKNFIQDQCEKCIANGNLYQQSVARTVITKNLSKFWSKKQEKIIRDGASRIPNRSHHLSANYCDDYDYDNPDFCYTPY